MAGTTDLIVNAKDENELALAMLALLVVAIAWIARMFIMRNNAFIEVLQKINSENADNTKSLHEAYNARIERLIEAHRVDTINSISQFTKALQELHIAIEKRNNICPQV